MLLSRPLKIAVLGLSLVALGGCDRQSADKAQPGVSESAGAGAVQPGKIDRSHKGSLMPDLVLKDPVGRELRLASLRGKPLLLNLWATWCAPCVAELPTLDRLARAGTPRVLAVSQDMGEPAKVAAFLTAHGIGTLAPWLDPENDLSMHYNTGTLPTTVYYDARGREVWRFVGDRDWTGKDTATLLAEAGKN